MQHYQIIGPLERKTINQSGGKSLIYKPFKKRKMINSREIKVKLLADVGNKAKGTVMLMKGNRAAKLKNKKLAEFVEDESVKINIIFTKEAKENMKKKRKVHRIRTVGASKPEKK
jgi:GTP-binding protein EngB required for normal cell division